MERLTVKTENGYRLVPPEEMCDGDDLVFSAINRLAELENKLESGQLVELPNKPLTIEQIKDIKLALECCADEIDGCPKCPYARKNSKDGIAHCREMYLDALTLINECEKNSKQTLAKFAEYLKDYVRQVQDVGYEGIGTVDIDEKLKEFLSNADIPE